MCDDDEDFRMDLDEECMICSDHSGTIILQWAGNGQRVGLVGDNRSKDEEENYQKLQVGFHYFEDI